MQFTFKKVNLVSLPGPHVHKRIDAIRGDSTPANLQRHRVTESSAVVPVLIQPVPAVPHEVGVEADDHLTIGRLLLPDPVEYSAESTFTASLWWPEQTQLYKGNKISRLKPSCDSCSGLFYTSGSSFPSHVLKGWVGFLHIVQNTFIAI